MWVQSEDGYYTLLPQGDESEDIVSLGWKSGTQLLVEAQEGGGRWPRRAFRQRRTFRDFEVRDRVDAQDYQGKW